MADYKEASRLADLLVKKTENGPVESWLSRMRDIVVPVGVPISHINWNGSPSNVAHDITSHLSRCTVDGLKRLDEALSLMY